MYANDVVNSLFKSDQENVFGSSHSIYTILHGNVNAVTNNLSKSKHAELNSVVSISLIILFLSTES